MPAFSSFLLYRRKATDTDNDEGQVIGYATVTNTHAISNRGINEPIMVVMVHEDVDSLPTAYFEDRKHMFSHYRLNPRDTTQWGEEKHRHQYRLLPEEGKFP